MTFVAVHNHGCDTVFQGSQVYSYTLDNIICFGYSSPMKMEASFLNSTAYWWRQIVCRSVREPSRRAGVHNYDYQRSGSNPN